MGVSKESISKFSIGNRFHVKLRIFSPYSNSLASVLQNQAQEIVTLILHQTTLQWFCIMYCGMSLCESWNKVKLNGYVKHIVVSTVFTSKLQKNAKTDKKFLKPYRIANSVTHRRF